MQQLAIIILLGTALGILLFFSFIALERGFGMRGATAAAGLSKTDDGYLRESPTAALTVFLRAVRYSDEVLLSVCVSGWDEGEEGLPEYRRAVLTEPRYRETFTIQGCAPYAWMDRRSGRRYRGEKVEGYITKGEEKEPMSYLMSHEGGYWKVCPEVQPDKSHL